MRRPTASRIRHLVVVVLATVAVNMVLFGVSDVLTREQPLRRETSPPVPVNLVQLASPTPPIQEARREPPPPRPKPHVDFQPELPPPSLTMPTLGGVSVVVDLDLGTGDLDLGPVVFEDADLDEPPRPVLQTPPPYPHRARQRGVEGNVTVKLLVTAEGVVADVQILEATPEGYFENAVVGAVGRWRFEPGRIAGQSVASWVVTTLRFDMDG